MNYKMLKLIYNNNIHSKLIINNKYDDNDKKYDDDDDKEKRREKNRNNLIIVILYSRVEIVEENQIFVVIIMVGEGNANLQVRNTNDHTNTYMTWYQQGFVNEKKARAKK